MWQKLNDNCHCCQPRSPEATCHERTNKQANWKKVTSKGSPTWLGGDNCLIGGWRACCEFGPGRSRSRPKQIGGRSKCAQAPRPRLFPGGLSYLGGRCVYRF